jgi:hypothetical protein
LIKIEKTKVEFAEATGFLVRAFLFRVFRGFRGHPGFSSN